MTQPLVATTPETLAESLIRTTFAAGLAYYGNINRRNWKNTFALGPEVDCLCCAMRDDLEARNQAIWLAASPDGRAFLLSGFGLLVGMHCFRLSKDGSSANVVVAPRLWPQMFGPAKETRLKLTPGLAHSYLLCWPNGQAQPDEPLPDEEASARLWAHAQATWPEALAFLSSLQAGNAAPQQAPEELMTGILSMLGPDGFHQVIAGHLGTSFRLGANRWIQATGQTALPSADPEFLVMSLS